MKILQIATPSQPTFAAFAIKNKKNAWVIERLPVVFFGLIPVTNGPGGKAIENEATIEPLVFNFVAPGASVATFHKSFLGIEVMATANAVPKDWSKELIAYIAANEPSPAVPIPPAQADTTATSSAPKEVKNETNQGKV